VGSGGIVPLSASLRRFETTVQVDLKENQEISAAEYRAHIQQSLKNPSDFISEQATLIQNDDPNLT
jgi:hypothetical protein